MFSVIMAAYQRREHIKPSIESVLRQSFHDFELCVVSDGPDEATEAAVASFASSKIRYYSMVECFGSQSYPNNCGIAETTAPWIAYLGHDDIWSAHHLSALAKAIRCAPQASVVASGCIFHGPPDSRVAWVTGIFDDAAFEITFLPPSSFAHKRSAAATVGGWRDPRVIVEAVDQDLLNRFVAAGCCFTSTRQITVHKFAAGHRYLYYLDQRSDEQSAMLRDTRLDQPDGWGAEVAAAKRNGTFTIPYVAGTGGAGEKFTRSKQMKGLSKTAAESLSGPVSLEPDNEDRALDWNGLELAGMPHRWSGPNPRPKLRIPFSHNGDARLTLSVVEYKGPLSEVTIRSRGVPLPVTVREAFGQFHLETVLPMSSTAPNVIELYTPTMFRPFDDRTDGPRLGIAIGNLTVQPL